MKQRERKSRTEGVRVPLVITVKVSGSVWRRGDTDVPPFFDLLPVRGTLELRYRASGPGFMPSTEGLKRYEKGITTMQWLVYGIRRTIHKALKRDTFPVAFRGSRGRVVRPLISAIVEHADHSLLQCFEGVEAFPGPSNLVEPFLPDGSIAQGFALKIISADIGYTAHALARDTGICSAIAEERLPDLVQDLIRRVQSGDEERV